MTNTDIDSPSGRRVWPKLLAASTVIVGMSTVLLHFLGMVVHRTYLAAWSVNSTQFPKSTDWLLLNGYYGIWNGLAMLFVALVANFHWLVLGVVTLLIYVRLLTSPWDPFTYLGAKLSKLQRLPQWVRRLGLWISVGMLIAAFLIPITLVLFLLIGIPATTGKVIGEEIFESHLKEVSKGCMQAKVKCIHIFKNDVPMGTGLVLDTSTTHLAYYDTDLNRARTVPLDGLEIRAFHAPKSHLDPAK
ncbi:MAG: hypothetical protein ACT6UH_17055 [Hydrogenophaga sp.]|uniref:hypothetical protein n=1 Tax=Hydrogenophaga sp. TaxID=1904254 RepID=UPI0040356C64